MHKKKFYTLQASSTFFHHINDSHAERFHGQVQCAASGPRQQGQNQTAEACDREPNNSEKWSSCVQSAGILHAIFNRTAKQPQIRSPNNLT